MIKFKIIIYDKKETINHGNLFFYTCGLLEKVCKELEDKISGIIAY